jgi:hypothetical protein
VRGRKGGREGCVDSKFGSRLYPQQLPGACLTMPSIDVLSTACNCENAHCGGTNITVTVTVTVASAVKE